MTQLVSFAVSCFSQRLLKRGGNGAIEALVSRDMHELCIAFKISSISERRDDNHIYGCRLVGRSITIEHLYHSQNV